MRAALLTTTALFLLTSGGAALAQSAPPQEDAQATQLDEVVVTSERRSGNLQDTPVAVTALTSEQLTSRGVQSILGLQNVVPSLSIGTQTNGSGASAATFYIRGLGQQRSGNGSEPAVAVYLDDFYYPSLAGNILKSLDLEGVEVLRGPQGTLFGRNTIGGAVRYTTKKPSQEFGGYAEATGGSFDRQDYSGAINIPLGDKVAARLTVADLHTGGYEEQQSVPGRIGASDNVLIRGQVRIRPTDDLTVDLSYDQFESELDGYPVYVPTISATAPLAGLYNFLNGGADYNQAFASTCRYCTYGGLPIESFDKSVARNWHAVVDYHFNDHLQLKSLTGYSVVKDDFFNDIDASPLLVGNQYGNSRVSAFSQEFQALGQIGERIRYVAGLFYYDEELDGFSGQTLPNGTRTVTQERTREAFSAYGNVTVNLTEKLSVTGGLRIGTETTDVTATTSAPVVNGAGSLDSDLTLPMVRVQYDWTDDVMTYATVGKGFRGGGFTVAPNPALPNAGVISFNPESVISYEAGARIETLNRMLRINPTIFYTDYSDIQVQRLLGTTPILENAGEGHLYGAELESRFVPTHNLSFNLTASYLKAEYDKVNPGVGVLITTPFARTPEWSYSVGGQYRMPFENGSQLDLNLDYSYRTEQWTSPTESDHLLIDGYGLVNARAQWTAPSGQWSVAAFATNLTDEQYFAGGIDLTPLVGLVRYDIGRPRELGVTLRASF